MSRMALFKSIPSPEGKEITPGCPAPRLNKDAMPESPPNSECASVITSRTGLVDPKLGPIYSFLLYPEPEVTEENLGGAAHVASIASITVIVEGR
jgi:hypothetical protein